MNYKLSIVKADFSLPEPLSDLQRRAVEDLNGVLSVERLGGNDYRISLSPTSELGVVLPSIQKEIESNSFKLENMKDAIKFALDPPEGWVYGLDGDICFTMSNSHLNLLRRTEKHYTRVASRCENEPPRRSRKSRYYAWPTAPTEGEVLFEWPLPDADSREMVIDLLDVLGVYVATEAKLTV